MGAGASAENARSTVANMLTNKPADASDIKVISTDSCVYFFKGFNRILNKLVRKLEIFVRLLENSKTN